MTNVLRRLVAAVIGVSAGLMLVAAPAAQAKVGPRVTIGVYGDSVAEGYTIRNYLADSLVPLLRNGLAQTGGFQAGATGLIPVSPFRWHFSAYTLEGLETARSDAWLLSGDTAFGADGPSGYSGVPLSPRATATAPIDGPLVAVLFTKFAGSSIFTVVAGSQTFAIDARSIGPPTPSEQWISVPPGTRTITVHGPSSGEVIFDGVIVRAPVTPGHIGVEVENLGHRGHRLSEDSKPRILASLLEQRFDISVFLDGYLWELFATANQSNNEYENGYANELRARAGLVRSYGGMCLIADPTPTPLPASVVARFAAIDRQVAREQGCAYTGGLAHLWKPATAVKGGLTQLDNFHPAARGYRLMANALLPELVTLVRERVRTRG